MDSNYKWKPSLKLCNACRPLIRVPNKAFYRNNFGIAANGKESEEAAAEEVLLIDLDDDNVLGGEMIVNGTEGILLGAASEFRAASEEAIEGDDGLQYEKGHWVS